MRGPRPGLGDEDGLTIIEVMVATLVLLTAAFGALQVLISSSQVNYRAEQATVVIERAQAEIEAIRALPFEEVALTAPPAMSTDSSSPASRVSLSCTNQSVSLNGCFAQNQNGSEEAPLVVEDGLLEEGGMVEGAAISPGPKPFETGDVSGTIHRYVVWENDDNCSDGQCPGTQDFKRVIVAIEIDGGSGGERAYRELQADFADSEAGRDSEPRPTDIEDTVAQSLYLSDTTCNQVSRDSPTSDHRAHNTLGDCSAGKQTGGTPGAPDLLTTSPPVLDPNFPDTEQPEYDYSNDPFPIFMEPLLEPDEDKGRQMLPRSLATCDFTLLETLTERLGLNVGKKYLNRWVTEEIPDTGGGAGFVIDGDAVLELNTRRMRGLTLIDPFGATLCVEVFIRDEAGNDTPLKNGEEDGKEYFRFPQTNWPHEWTELSIPMDLQDPSGSETIAVEPGERLGISLAVHLVNVNPPTANPFISFMYEHPGYKSRLEVETTTPYMGAPSLAG